MNIKSFSLGPVMTNAYLVYHDRTKKGVVIDPGSGPTSLLKYIQEKELQIEAILLTHAHFDHIGGLEEVRKVTGADVYIHQEEQSWLEDPNRNGSALFPGIEMTICRPAEHTLQGGETLRLLDEPFQVIHTPGHSPGSISFITSFGVLGGDVLFQGSIGRTDLPGGDFKTLAETIRTKFYSLSDETVVYPGHGGTTTIGMEKKINPFVPGL